VQLRTGIRAAMGLAGGLPFGLRSQHLLPPRTGPRRCRLPPRHLAVAVPRRRQQRINVVRPARLLDDAIGYISDGSGDEQTDHICEPFVGVTHQPRRRRFVPPLRTSKAVAGRSRDSRNQIRNASLVRYRRKEYAMKTFLSSLALTAVLILAGCDNNVEPTKATGDTVDQNPKIDKDPTPKSTTGGDQPATPPAQ
jgi:hypothetical protein